MMDDKMMIDYKWHENHEVGLESLKGQYLDLLKHAERQAEQITALNKAYETLTEEDCYTIGLLTAENQRLKSELSQAKCQCPYCDPDGMAMEIRRLKDGLDIYGYHRVGCSFFTGQSVCNCGFDELMEAAPPQKGVSDE